MSNTVATRAVQRAVRVDHAAAAAALAIAFREDPVARWVTPDPARRQSMLRGFSSLVTEEYLSDGEV